MYDLGDVVKFIDNRCMTLVMSSRIIIIMMLSVQFKTEKPNQNLKPNRIDFCILFRIKNRFF